MVVELVVKGALMQDIEKKPFEAPSTLASKKHPALRPRKNVPAKYSVAALESMANVLLSATTADQIRAPVMSFQ